MAIALIHRLRKYDAFAKTHEDASTQTAMGGLMTLVCMVSVGLLVLTQYVDYMTVKWTSEMTLDRSRQERMTIHFDIEFPQIPCCVMTVDILDEASDHQMNVRKSITKIRQDATGAAVDGSKDANLNNTLVASDPSYCGSCYAATVVGMFGDIPCCNTCEEVQDAYRAQGIPLPAELSEFEQCSHESFKARLASQQGEGCRIAGYVEVNKIPGNLHFAPGPSIQVGSSVHLHDLRALGDAKFNMTHTIHHMSFGDYDPNMFLPLNGYAKVAKYMDQMYTYSVKVVQTAVYKLSGEVLNTNQFSATNYQRMAQEEREELPGVYFLIDISAMMVVFKEHVEPLSTFVTHLCAIVGGVYTVAQLLDSLIYSAEKRLLHKHNIGKGM